MKNNLRKLRGCRSQAEVASAIGITKAHYVYIENESRLPSLPVALRLIDYFEVRLEDIFVLPQTGAPPGLTN